MSNYMVPMVVEQTSRGERRPRPVQASFVPAGTARPIYPEEPLKKMHPESVPGELALPGLTSLTSKRNR